MRGLFWWFVCVVGLVLSGCSTIGRRLVLPGSYLKAPANIVSPSPDYELARLVTEKGSPIVVLFAHAVEPDGREKIGWRECQTVIFCYGNGMSIAQSLPIVRDIRSMGANVAVVEYPGYGMSPGVPSEEGCYAAAVSTYQFVVDRQHVAPTRVVAIGLSLGSSVALELAARRPVSGVVVVVPFTRTLDVGTDKLPWYLRWSAPMLTRKVPFDNLSKLARVDAPLLLVSARRDQISSASRTRQLIAVGHQGQITHVEVDSDHDGAWSAGRQQIGQWLRRQSANAEKSP